MRILQIQLEVNDPDLVEHTLRTIAEQIKSGVHTHESLDVDQHGLSRYRYNCWNEEAVSDIYECLISMYDEEDLSDFSEYVYECQFDSRFPDLIFNKLTTNEDRGNVWKVIQSTPERNALAFCERLFSHIEKQDDLSLAKEFR
ncbi:MAG TPA: hypothetical protein VM577_02475, partial [Anaerovoracaceae bacterium]|nr:hypothetical protein [Anaerovoracaceae bacterium]